MKIAPTLDDTPEVRRAYAAGLRMAMEILELSADSYPWWLPFKPQARRQIASLRQAADFISREAETQENSETK